MARAHWSSRVVFVLAAAGSAAGLGNIWKFPYIAGVNGGGAFVLIYLGFILAVGIPIFIAECYIGRSAQKNVVEAFEVLDRPKSPWRYVGWSGFFAGLFILAFYHVVGGWILDFEYHSLLNHFASKSEEEIQGFMSHLFNGPVRQVFWQFVFTAFTVGIVLGGLKDGIEKWNKILMPALILLLVGLFIRSMFLPGFGQAMSFLFSPDASKLSGKGILEAVGHTFFTLSLGMGSIITYGSYLDEDSNLVSASVLVALMDTVIALIAGIVIFSIVFSFQLEPGAGPTLLFSTLPMLFQRLAGGYIISVSFFLLVTFAALTSSISILEVLVAYWVEKHNASRVKTTLVFGVIIFFLGVPCALSTNELANFKILGFTFFDLLDKLTSSVMLPIGGLLISLFYGWVLGPKAVEATVSPLGSWKHVLAVGLLWATRVIAPVGVLVVFIKGLLG